jgi:hypothetical protein
MTKDNWEGVNCDGCEREFGKNGVKHATSNNLADQHLCDRCNMKLIRWFGSDYGERLEDPARKLQEREERIRIRRDEKSAKKYFRSQLDFCDELDMSIDDKATLFRLLNKYIHFETLPEARHLLTFHTSEENVKSVKGTGA